jgi:hypothetical protein
MSKSISNISKKSFQSLFSENYDLKLAMNLSKTEAESKKLEHSVCHAFEHVLPPIEAFEIINERLNLFFK